MNGNDVVVGDFVRRYKDGKLVEIIRNSVPKLQYEFENESHDDEQNEE